MALDCQFITTSRPAPGTTFQVASLYHFECHPTGLLPPNSGLKYMHEGPEQRDGRAPFRQEDKHVEPKKKGMGETPVGEKTPQDPVSYLFALLVSHNS